MEVDAAPATQDAQAAPMGDAPAAEDAAERAAQRARCAGPPVSQPVATPPQQWPGVGTMYGKGLESRAAALAGADMHVPGRQWRSTGFDTASDSATLLRQRQAEMRRALAPKHKT